MHSTPLLRRRLALLVAALCALALPLVTGQPASAEAPAPVTWHVKVGAETADMAVTAMAFLPREVWIDKGDVVRWTAASAEPHTVTFLAPGTTLPEFNPFDPTQTTLQGMHRYDGTAYANSGILATQPIFVFTTPATAYSLRFTKTGDFAYYCLLHGAMMKGVVHVRPQGTPYRYTQRDYDRMGHRQAQALLRRGSMAWHEAKMAHPARSGQVQVGIDGPGFAVMRFVRTHAVVHVGQTVTFSVAGPGAPHTVTFGEEPPGLAILAPSGDPTSYAGGDLNSGVIAPGAPFVVTFTTAGTFTYICAIHDDMGMVGDVTVLP